MSAPTKAEKHYWNQVAELGCIACLQDGYRNPIVSIHHCDGRTKPYAHLKVLGLCAGHHQRGANTNCPTMLAIHGDKARFEAKYGTQAELMQKTADMLEKKGY